MATTYTYLNFATDIIALLARPELEELENLEKMQAKAQNLYDTHLGKSIKAKENPRPKKPRPLTEKTVALIALLEQHMTTTPKTAAELSADAGREITPLQLANAASKMENVIASKVTREAVGTNGLKGERFYTAYAFKA